MPNEFSVRLVPAKMAGVVSPRGGGGGGYFFFENLIALVEGSARKRVKTENFFFFR